MLASLNSMHEKLSYKMLHLRQLSLWSLEEDKGRATLLGEDNNTKVGIILLVESSVHKTWWCHLCHNILLSELTIGNKGPVSSSLLLPLLLRSRHCSIREQASSLEKPLWWWWSFHLNDILSSYTKETWPWSRDKPQHKQSTRKENGRKAYCLCCLSGLPGFWRIADEERRFPSIQEKWLINDDPPPKSSIKNHFKFFNTYRWATGFKKGCNNGALSSNLSLVYGLICAKSWTFKVVPWLLLLCAFDVMPGNGLLPKK